MHWVRLDRRFSSHRVRFAFALLALGAAGLATAFVVVPASGSSSTAAVVATTVVVKGTDTGVSIAPKTFAKGTVTFKITNNGSKTHTFVVAGKRTKVNAHSTVVTTIVFESSGSFAWTWTGTKAITGKLTVTGGGGTTGTVRTTTTTTTTPPPTSCSNPTTTITVGMFEYRFELSQQTVPAGCIQFVITDKGIEPHNFDITGVKSGTILAPGQSETWAVMLAPKTYNYVCDVPFHVDRGMVGQLVVT